MRSGLEMNEVGFWGLGGLAVKGLEVGFGDVVALDGLDLEVDAGEIVAVLGPSGCGKSTLLRAIAGLQPLDSGSVFWSGNDLADVEVHKRGFGFMFQDHALFTHKDVAANVGFGLRMAGASPKAQAQRVSEVLEIMGLAGYEKRSVLTLSGGESQRVALARALAPRPKLLMLDEPLGSLDRLLRDSLARELRALLKSAGITALHVTHDHDEAFAVADRVAVMFDGQIAQVDSPDALWRNPLTERIARFLGHQNVVAGEPFLGSHGFLSDEAFSGNQAVLIRGDAFTYVSDSDEAANNGSDTVCGTVNDVRFNRDRYEIRLVDVSGLAGVELVVFDHHSAEVGERRCYKINPTAIILLNS